MDIEVGVDPTGDRARLYDGHGHPFSVQVVKGWHARPGKETVTTGPHWLARCSFHFRHQALVPDASHTALRSPDAALRKAARAPYREER